MIRKALILAAGKGTRMQEISKGHSKEMVYLGNHPAIFYSIKEALKAGCKEIGVVINGEKRDLHDYLLKQKNNGYPIEVIAKDSKGMIDSMLAAKEFIEDENFCMIFPDMIYMGEQSALEQVIDAFGKFNFPVASLFNDSPEFGKGAFAEVSLVKEKIFLINSIGQSGNLRFFGRYAFNNKTLSYLDLFSPEESEKRLLEKLIEEQRLYGVFLEKEVFDMGIPSGYFKAKESFEDKLC